MKRFALSAATTLLAIATANSAMAHCQVPCGIYGDQRRFEEMLEDTQTIAKAITEIKNLAGTHDATGHNQLARWVVTKEDHATNVQMIIAKYFLAQRIKPDAENYVDQLKAAHKVMVAAMKCKQAADPATAEALRASVLDLYKAYTGKEPQLGATEASKTTPVSAKSDSHSHGDHLHSHDHADHDHSHASKAKASKN